MISVVIPTLNEEEVIEDTLLSVCRGGKAEIIVADGGSSDSTVDIAEKVADLVIDAPRGRGAQMNAGADAAAGDMLLFLHADTILPARWTKMVADAVERKDASGGAFLFSLPGHGLKTSIIVSCVNLRSRLLALPYGDQGLFVRRDIFFKLGGFQDMPLMEDVEMVRRIKREGKLVILDRPVITSSRRWNKEGWIKTTVVNQLLLYLYLAGVNPERLYKFYRSMRL